MDEQATEPLSHISEVQRFALPFLLITFPLTIALLPTPSFVFSAFALYFFLAHFLNCKRGFLFTLLGSLLINALFYSGATIHGDVDSYLAPHIRLIASSFNLMPDGVLQLQHLKLPSGFVSWCAAWYRLTGWIDCGGMLFFMLLTATWLVLRTYLSKWQSVALILSPAAFPSLFLLMSDGCVYLLLLIALVMLHDKKLFWMPLAAIVVAATFKTTAWIPCVLTMLVLLYYRPRAWWKLALAGLFILLWNLPTLRMILSGGLSEISADFENANEAANAMGYWARLAYVYVGHWTTSAQPIFGAHLASVDGGGVDGFGPLFRVACVSSIVTMICFRNRLRSWAVPLIVAWVSIFMMPTLYIGYARYVPWLYPAVLLPLVVLLPRVSTVLSCALCVLPTIWLGWRVMLATEYVAVATHATAVHSDIYNIRCAFRDHLSDTPQTTLSGSLMYTYTMPSSAFPAMNRDIEPNLKQQSPLDKIKSMRRYALYVWLPWAIQRAPIYFWDLICLRIRWFLAPRGASDELSTTHS